MSGITQPLSDNVYSWEAPNRQVFSCRLNRPGVSADLRASGRAFQAVGFVTLKPVLPILIFGQPGNYLEMGRSTQPLVSFTDSEQLSQTGRPIVVETVPNVEIQLLCHQLSHWQPVELLQARAGMPHPIAWLLRSHHESHSPILDALQFAELLFRCCVQKAITII